MFNNKEKDIPFLELWNDKLHHYYIQESLNILHDIEYKEECECPNLSASEHLVAILEYFNL